MSKARILIVEDSFIVSFHLKATLESEGYVVIGQCNSGENALEFVELTRPDLVLMDIMLSGKLDGIETASELRAKHNLPVIYITALTDKDTINRAKVTEPFGYLTKPFEDLQIFTVIEMALYKHDVESRLKQSEAKFFSTVNSISDCVVSVDRDFRVSYINPSAESITGWNVVDAIGQAVGEVLSLVQDGDQSGKVNPLQCAIAPGKSSHLPDDLILIRKNGEPVPIGESSISTMVDKTGRISGFIIIFRDLTAKREHRRLMTEIKRYEIAAQIEGQEKERFRIAKDLHDGLGQMLNAIKMNLSMLVADSGEVLNLSRLLDEAIQESIRISENLLPAKLRDFELPVCLNSFCASMAQSTKLNVRFEMHGTHFHMSQSQKVNFFRIAQEAVNNAVKHSRASTILLLLEEENGLIRLTIEDNGTGRTGKNESVISTGSGLVNMRDRADSMGGKFLLANAENGTRVIVEVPVNKLKIHAES
jgi:PAS domain S-box-containing protein